MQINVNGQCREFLPDISVASLLETLGLKSEATVVQVNNNVVNRKKFIETLLADGDNIELVRIVGGG